jgi:hypothetical protein
LKAVCEVVLIAAGMNKEMEVELQRKQSCKFKQNVTKSQKENKLKTKQNKIK